MVRSLRGRLVLLACLATLPAFLFVLFVATQERGAALRRAESETRFVANLASREHAHQVVGAQRLLRRLAKEGAASPDLEPLGRLLPAVLSGFPQFANLGILAPDGRLLHSVVPPPRPVDMSRNPAVLAALRARDVVVGRYQVGQIVGRPVLILAQSVRGPEETVLGVLFAALDLEWLDKLALQAQVPQDFTLVIADREGRVLARASRPGPPGFEEGDRIPSMPEMVRGPGLTREFGRDGIPRLFTAAPMDGIPDLFVLAGLPESRVVGVANRAFSRAILALVVLTLLTVTSSIAAADLSVLRDVRLLAGATRRFGAGDLKARAQIPSAGGEIQDLILAFNGMADALEQRDWESSDAQDKLRALSRRVEATREEEGARISRELHDQLGQELTALKLELAQVKRKLQVSCPSSASGEVGLALDQVGAQIDGCVESVRRISAELRPSVLDRLGLGPALEWLTREFERRTGLPASYEGSDSGALDPSVATTLFRITQEALTNIARHAGASSVQVEFSRDGEQLVLAVHDDGTGFDAEAERASLGILGMRERARLAGGTLAIESGPAGTHILARVPRRPINPQEGA